ncbi:hypothetical protein F4777DRAFT_574082 [Nemania sp. FL0916]|nr:hypothetical protein F4777DRAFT_574082 [Nemania sp. FL0916]
MMFIKALFITTLAPLGIALATTARSLLLPCSTISGTPCICPFGTDYSESVTVALIGATATNVEAVTNDFFNPSWTGLELWSVQGPDNFPGLSIRDMNISTPVGTYVFSQRLTFWFVFPDGSFEQRYEQRGIIPYLSSNGSFAGNWVTLKGSRISENETLVQFSNYACDTGHPLDFAAVHGSSLTNATTILEVAGLIHGVSTDSISAQSF